MLYCVCVEVEWHLVALYLYIICKNDAKLDAIVIFLERQINPGA